MEVQILGPLEVRDEGSVVDLGHHKQKSLLALLLIHANRVVSTDRILDEIWGEDAAGKENTLWVYVSRLRSALGGAEVLVTKDHGYTLATPPATIDAHRFEEAVQQGRSLLTADPAAAAEQLRQGLDLWRGTALQDFEFDDFAQLELVRLNELRLTATEDRIEADLRSGYAGELVTEIELLHDQHPLRERLVEQLMLALYRTGRQADALRAFERYRRGLAEELGLEPTPELRRLEEQILLHDSRLQSGVVAKRRLAGTAVGENPYNGLLAFGEDDAERFFGRERLVSEATRKLAEHRRLLALVGPSGAGKSSAVRAGLIPAIRKGAIPGSDRWLIARMVPGAHPFAELEAALLWSTLDAPDSLSEQLAGDASGLLRSALRLLPTDEAKLLLVIDQFEELFTLVEDEAVRIRFLDNLSVAVDDPHHRVLVVLTMRADFYDRPLHYPEFGSRLGEALVNVLPMSPDELEAAALEPARQAGVTLEPELLAELLTDVVGQPGALPLFQYVLTELFDRRVGTTLTVESYRAMGGVRGALTKRAEEVYRSLDEPERSVARQLLLRLVTLTEDDQWSRRRVRAEEITSLDVDIVELQQTIDAFGTARLLSFDRDHVSGSPTVEVAHEALLVEWPRLREWIEQARSDLQRHAAFVVAMREWSDASRDPDYLLAGARLDEYERWCRTSSLDLNTSEHAYLNESLAARQEQLEADAARIRAEEKLRRSSRRRTWALAAALGALVAVVVAVVILATRSDGPEIALVSWGPDGRGGVLDLLDAGWEDAKRDLRFVDHEVVPLIDPEEEIRQLAKSGTDLIVTELFWPGLVQGIAPDYPDTRFVVFSEDTGGADNVTALHFVRHNGAYLMGVVAGRQTQTNKVGHIGAAQQITTEARRAAFSAGALAVNPDVEVVSIYLGPIANQNDAFRDPELGREAATAMYGSGVDVIFHSAGDSALGIVEAADELSDQLRRPLWVIGSETDEYLTRSESQREHVLTSMYKRWDRALLAAIDDFIEGQLPAGVVEYDLEPGNTGLVAYSPAGGRIDGLVPELESTQAALASGAIIAPHAVDHAPSWTTEAEHAATVTVVGDRCDFDLPETSIGDGVLRVDVVNGAVEPVTVEISDPDSAWGPATATAGGAANALAVAVWPGVWTIECSTEQMESLGSAELVVVPPGLPEGPSAADETDPEALAALAVIEGAIRAFNSGNASEWVALRDKGSVYPSEEERQADLPAWEAHVAAEHAVGTRMEIVDCISHGHGVWPGIADTPLPDAVGFRFTCEIETTDSFRDLGGVAAIEFVEWVVDETTVIAAAGRDGDFQDWVAFTDDFVDWIFSTHPDVVDEIRFFEGEPGAGEHGQYGPPLPESVPLLVEYAQLFVDASDDWPQLP